MAVPRLNPVYGFAKDWGWRPSRGNYVGTGVASAFNPQSKWHNPASIPVSGGLASPPTGTFDPALEAQRRAAQRGMHDTLQDVETKEHFTTTDLNQALQNLRVNVSRKRQDLGNDFRRKTGKLGTDYSRAQEGIGNQEADTRRTADRQSEDFNTQLSNLARQFTELGHRQGEAANAAGVADQGTSAASAAARARNQIQAEAPIHTAQARQAEDLAETLGRLGVSRHQLDEDRARSAYELNGEYETTLGRLGQDRNLERESARRQAARELFEGKRTAGRARREGAITNLDILEEEVYQARREHPGAFAGSQEKAGGSKSNQKKKGR